VDRPVYLQTVVSEYKSPTKSLGLVLQCTSQYQDYNIQSCGESTELTESLLKTRKYRSHRITFKDNIKHIKLDF